MHLTGALVLKECVRVCSLFSSLRRSTSWASIEGSPAGDGQVRYASITLMAELKLDFLESYDEAAIVAELRRIASITGKDTVTRADIETVGRMSYSVVNKRFGSLRKALEAARLQPRRYMKATDAELLNAVVELWEQTLEQDGRRPYRADLKRYGFTVSSDTIVRRFESWKRALTAAYDSVQPTRDVESPEQGAQLEPNTPDNVQAAGTSRSVPLRKRFFVMKRDSFACRLCGASGRGVRLEVDHVTPVAGGGSDALDNLQTLCFDCNRGKRDSTIDA